MSCIAVYPVSSLIVAVSSTLKACVRWGMKEHTHSVLPRGVRLVKLSTWYTRYRSRIDFPWVMRDVKLSA